jgi:hypothetical protein
LYAISVILDPRHKMDYYQANGWEADVIAYAKDALQQAVEAYGTTEAATVAEPQSKAASFSEELAGKHAQKMKRRRVEKESELERYLAAPTIGFHEDILEWWKHHAYEYPCLARVARDYLAIPATGAPSERVFSGGADLITDKRGSLSDDTIRACICLDSWL